MHKKQSGVSTEVINTILYIFYENQSSYLLEFEKYKIKNKSKLEKQEGQEKQMKIHGTEEEQEEKTNRLYLCIVEF